MKLITYSQAGGAPKIGAVGADDSVVDLSELAADMRLFFVGGEPTMEAARELVAKGRTDLALADVRLLAPIRPGKFFHTAGNFREHEEESKRVDFSHPIAPWILFFQNVDAIVGPDEPVIYPSHLTRELDYELELCVVLAKDGKNFDADEAEDYIGGYVLFNDITARDIQRREMESGIFSFCKSIDTFSPVGPWIVTKDEIDDAQNLDMRLRVNGEDRQVSNTSHMDYTIPEIVASYAPLTYRAGDILSTGTVAGIAAFSEDPEAWFLQPGDVMEAEVEKVGMLRNRVISWEEAYGEPAPPAVATGAV